MGNIFLILEEYDHLKRNPGETIHQFSARFNKVYHAIPTDIRPPPGSAHLHYPNAFNPKMTFQLRERNTATLEEMQKIAVEVEANLLNKRSNVRKTRPQSNKIKQMWKTKHRRYTIQERHRFTWFTQCGLRPPEKLPGPSFIIIQQMKGYNLQQNPL
jgi:hypothetical protein